MARPRKWASEAERIADYRRRKREEQVDPALPVVDLSAEPDPTAPSVPPPRLSLDEYVNEAITGAELHHAATSTLATLSTKDLAGTLERAEAYARWRYAAYLEGEVNGL